jgi:hypothetical protein
LMRVLTMLMMLVTLVMLMMLTTLVMASSPVVVWEEMDRSKLKT